MITIRAVLGLLPVLLLAGCVSLPEQPAPPHRYVLDPLSAGEESRSPLNAGFRVTGVHLPAGLSTDRIAVLREEGRLDHLAGARWAVPLSRLLEDYFTDSLENRWGTIAWGRAPARYRLVMAVRDFQAEYRSGLDQAPMLRVNLVAVLLPATGNEVLARATERRSRRGRANRVEAVVEGLEGLLGEAYGSVLDRFGKVLRKEGLQAKSPGDS